MLFFLIGFMGAGKTTLGREVALSLGLSFIDLDAYLEEQERCTIAEIFAEKGETYFRKREREVLEEMAQLPKGKYLIATGGGLPCQGDNLHWMNSHGVTFYLRQSPELLISRLSREAHSRPLLARIPEEKRAAYIRSLLEQRERWYLQAHHILEGEALSPAGLIRELLLAIKAQG